MACDKCSDHGIGLLVKGGIFGGIDLLGEKILQERMRPGEEIEKMIVYIAVKCLYQSMLAGPMAQMSMKIPALGPLCPCKLVENLVTVIALLLNNKFVLKDNLTMKAVISTAVAVYGSDIAVDLLKMALPSSFII